MLLPRGRQAALLAVLAVLLPVAAASPLGLGTHIVASERPGGFGYLNKDTIVDVGGTLLLTNADVRSHDVVSDANGPSTNPWCAAYPSRACPLFASPLIGFAEQAVVEGTDQLVPLTTYSFICTIHPGMAGTLTAL